MLLKAASPISWGSQAPSPGTEMHLCLLRVPTQSPGFEASGAALPWETLSLPSWAPQVTASKGHLSTSQIRKVPPISSTSHAAQAEAGKGGGHPVTDHACGGVPHLGLTLFSSCVTLRLPSLNSSSLTSKSEIVTALYKVRRIN